MAGKFSSVGFPNTEFIKLNSENIIGDKLDKIQGTKDIVIDPELMTPLDRIMGASALKGHNIDKIFKLENPIGPIRNSSRRIYLVKSRPELMKTISGQIIMDREAGVVCEYSILMVPRRLYTCEKVLEEEGVYGYVTLDDLPINLIVIDDDILSVEAKSFHRSYFLDKDFTGLHDVAQSLCDIEGIYGRFNNMYFIGSCSQKVDHIKKMLDLRDERSKSESRPNTTFQKSNADHFTHLIMVDRDIDMVTPLCTPVTYEALVNDMLDINCGYVQLGPEITSMQKPTKVLLSNKDKIFQEIRNRHFSNVHLYLSAKIKEFHQIQEKIKTMDVQSTKVFVQKELKDLKNQGSSVSTHFSAYEFITKKKTKEEIQLHLRLEHNLLTGIDLKENITFIEELINRQVDLKKSLNLLCLLSITEGGLLTPTYKSLVLQFLQSYGYGLLPSIHNLKRVGLLSEIVSQNVTANLLSRVVNLAPQGAFRTVARKLNLINRSEDTTNLKNPNDMSYVFGGAYSPLLCRVVEQILTQDGTNVEEVLKSMNVPTTSHKESGVSLSTKVVLVYFMGGCTYSEIAALRFIAKQRGFLMVIATTSIVSSQNFVTSFL